MDPNYIQNIKAFIKKNYICISLSCLCIIFFITKEADFFSFRIFITSIFIQVYSIINIFDDKEKPFSLKKIFFLFSVFFFGIAPLIQFYENSKMWEQSLTEEQYFFMNIIIIVILITYNLFYKIFFKTFKAKNKKSIVERLTIQDQLTTSQTAALIIIALSALLVVLHFNNFSLSSLLVRTGELKESVSTASETSSTQSLIVYNFFRPMVMMCLLYYLYIPKKNIGVVILLSIIAVATCFPLGIARFATATLYIALLLVLFPSLKRKNLFTFVFIGGLLIVFPLLNNFRTINSFSEIGLNNAELSMFSTEHFDSYANTAQIILNDITTNGKQLLGVILFWIPRSIWHDKPLGSGSVLADTLNLKFDNIAVNYFAEGYINFGYIGILLFLVLLAYLTARIDYLFWVRLANNRRNAFYIVYLILLGLLFFILRGALISAFAYSVGFIFAFFVVFYMVKATQIIEVFYKNKKNE